MGTAELVIVGIVLLVFFGSNKMKEIARGLGESTKEFKTIKKEYEKTVNEAKKI
jgi:sec-independent protein translocase protein TatA